jgi:hypothetical protein
VPVVGVLLPVAGWDEALRSWWLRIAQLFGNNSIQVSFNSGCVTAESHIGGGMMRVRAYMQGVRI